MAQDIVSKRNGFIAALLGLCGTLLTAVAIASFSLLWSMSSNVAAINVSVENIGEQVTRMEVRHTRAYNGLDRRLRDVELGDR